MELWQWLIVGLIYLWLGFAIAVSQNEKSYMLVLFWPAFLFLWTATEVGEFMKPR